MGQEHAVAAVVLQVWYVQGIPLGTFGLQQPHLLLMILPQVKQGTSMITVAGQ